MEFMQRKPFIAHTNDIIIGIDSNTCLYKVIPQQPFYDQITDWVPKDQHGNPL